MTLRQAGILLPLPSVPGRSPAGTLGPAARSFLDFLVAGRQGIWQMLPVCVTNAGTGDSPYSALSAFALDPILLSAEDLAEDGLLTAKELADLSSAPTRRIGFEKARDLANRVGRAALPRVRARPRVRAELEVFRDEAAAWLDDYALFRAIREEASEAAWTDWPADLRDREPKALARASRRLRSRIDFHAGLQFLLHRQWARLKREAEARRIQLLGDLPLYVAHDSADVWSHRHLFALSEDGTPSRVAGVPPDYFSKTGQLWGNPVYDWWKHGDEDYAWWRRRVAHALDCFDAIRFDHFRGLAGFWEVPAAARTAAEGHWTAGPGAHFLEGLLRGRESLPIVAEDLGTIDADVRELRQRFSLPGMRVLQFGFGDDFAASEHLPHHHEAEDLVFTGTHDNNTTRGWFEGETSPAVRRRIEDYVGHRVRAGGAAEALLRLAYGSVSSRAIVPMQDVLGLGAAARLNRPGLKRGNWRWRAGSRSLSAQHAERLAAWAETYART